MLTTTSNKIRTAIICDPNRLSHWKEKNPPFATSHATRRIGKFLLFICTEPRLFDSQIWLQQIKTKWPCNTWKKLFINMSFCCCFLWNGKFIVWLQLLSLNSKKKKMLWIVFYKYLIIQNSFLSGTSVCNKDILYQSNTTAPSFRIYSFLLINQVDSWQT